MTPVGTVIGIGVVLDASGWSRGLDGSEIVNFSEAFRDALGLAKQRITAEAEILGANIVADIRFELPTEFESERVRYQTGLNQEQEGEFLVLQLTGTAYRYPEIGSPATPVLTNLTAIDVAKLTAHGLKPVALCVGHSFYYQGQGFRSANLKRTESAEHPDYTRAVQAAQSTAASRMNAMATEAGADGIVGYHVHLREIKKHAAHMDIRILVSGTAVKRDPYTTRTEIDIQPVVQLSDRQT